MYMSFGEIVTMCSIFYKQFVSESPNSDLNYASSSKWQIMSNLQQIAANNNVTCWLCISTRIHIASVWPLAGSSCFSYKYKLYLPGIAPVLLKRTFCSVRSFPFF